MLDVYDIDPRHPKFETSREPERKLFSFRGQFADDNDVMFDFFFKGWYEEDGSGIRIIEHTFLHQTTVNNPRFRKNYGDAKLRKVTLIDILRSDIMDYLKITGHVHFESKLEL